MSPTKQQMIEIIQEQPDDSSASEILKELALHLATQNGSADADGGRTISSDDALPSLAETVLKIQALGPDPKAIHRATKPMAQVAEDLAQNPPSPELLRQEELLPLWQQFERELKEFDSPVGIGSER